jgi:hypothetical protein
MQLAEYTELKDAAQTLVDMVDPQVERTPSTKTLVERLREAPKKVVGYLSDNTKLYVAHVLGLFKSYWPQANLVPLGEGMAVECSEEKFSKFREEAKPIAERIVQCLEQDEES